MKAKQPLESGAHARISGVSAVIVYDESKNACEYRNKPLIHDIRQFHPTFHGTCAAPGKCEWHIFGTLSPTIFSFPFPNLPVGQGFGWPC